MESEIRRLEQTARLLEPDSLQRNDLFEQASDWAETFLAGLPASPAYSPAPEQRKFSNDLRPAEEGTGMDALLKILNRDLIETGINPASGRFLGYIPGGGLYPSALGDYLAAITNRYAGVYYASPGAARMENELVRWMAEVAGYPEGAVGSLASGGSIANLTGIVAARDAAGVTGEKISKSVVYLTEHAHHCIDKALRIAGLGGCVLRRVAVDSRCRMDAAALNTAIFEDRRAGLIPWLLVASAGTTNTGAVDPLPDLADIARENGLWFHVDGAYGAFFNLCPPGKAALIGMEESDSIVMDPHKTLFLPYGTGAVLLKDRSALSVSHRMSADYMQDAVVSDEELSPADLSPELTRHFRGLRLWLPLRLFGVGVFRAALSEKILLARYFYEQIRELPSIEVGSYPELSVATYRFLPERGDPDEFNQRLIGEIVKDGRIFLSSTRLNGKFTLRLAVGCFRTHLDDINETIEILVRTAKRLQEEI